MRYRLALATVALALSATTPALAADARSPAVQLIAQAAPSEERFIWGDWSVPRDHRYDTYDTRSRQYTAVNVGSVPARLDRGEFIYDQTAGVWITHPSGGRNPSYLASSYQDTRRGGRNEGAASPGVTSGVPRSRAIGDSTQAGRLQRLMLPLVGVMDHPVPANQLSVAITDDPQINASSAGGGQFAVTSGLLQKANDDQLRSVLAHELAHQDLNHVAKAQILGVGLNIGATILNQIFPGSGAIAPLAGELVARKYSRTEEYAADKHGAELLVRAGYSKQMMITLTWLMQSSGSDSGGFFADHPGTGDRIEALRRP